MNEKQKRITKFGLFVILGLFFIFGFSCMIITEIPELQNNDFVKNYMPIISTVSNSSLILLAAFKFLTSYLKIIKITKKTNDDVEKIKNETESKTKYNEDKEKVKKLISKNVDGKMVAEDDRIEIWRITENDKKCYVIKSKNEILTDKEIWTSIDNLSTKL